MLKQLAIHNFQSHADTVVDLVPGINVFVGSTDTGKTAILRALYWVLKNKPLGEGIIRHGTKEAWVNTVWETKGKEFEVGRERGKSENSYTLTGFDDFTAFGSSPPKEVLEAINLSDINLQRQFSPYFLVVDSPGSVARFIKSVTGLADIDKIAENLSSKLRKNRADIVREEDDLKEKSEQLKKIELIPLQKFELDLKELENLLQQVSTRKERQGHIANMCNQLQVLRKAAIVIPEERFGQIKVLVRVASERYAENRHKETQIKAALSLWKKLEAEKIVIPEKRFKELGAELQEVLERYNLGVSKREKLEAAVSTLKELSKKALEITFQSDLVNTAIKQYNTSCSRLLELHELIETIYSSKDEAKENLLKLKTLRMEEADLRQQLKTCPACGTELTDKSKATLLG